MTEKKKAASRANGAKSRGPATEDGRQRSSQNAIKHGLCASQVVLTNESEERFENYRASMLEEFQPSSPVQIDLVDQMVSTQWRLNRLYAVETAALEREMIRITPELEAKFENLKEDSRVCVATQNLMGDSESRFLVNLSRHESRLTRIYNRALQNLLKLRSLPPCPTPAPSPQPLAPAPQPLTPNPQPLAPTPAPSPQPPPPSPVPPTIHDPQPTTFFPQNEPENPSSPYPSNNLPSSAASASEQRDAKSQELRAKSVFVRAKNSTQ